MNTLKRHGFFWVMLALFVGSLAAHWVTAWVIFVDEETEHGKPIVFSTYFVEVLRQTMENWQSEMLQLILQISLISYFWFVGSPSSKSEEDRLEAKVDWLMEQLNEPEASNFKRYLDKRYPKK